MVILKDLYENAGELTKHCLDSLLNDEYTFFDEEDNYTEEYLLTYPFKNFSDGFTEVIQKHGFSGNPDSTEEKVKFVRESCQKNHVELNIANIRNWFQEKRPVSSETSRDLVFRLCFGLGMNLEEVTEFFLKVYFECPFNFRNHEEVIYYFCFLNHLNYDSAVKLKEKADSILEQTEPEQSTYELTSAIGSELKQIHTEEEMLKYIQKNSSEFLVNNRTALKNAQRLLAECTTLATNDFKKYEFHAENETISHYSSKKENVDLFLNMLLSVDMMQYSSEKSFAKASAFPELVKSNFPLKMQLSKIKNEKPISYDAMRKALIVLSFYDYFTKLFEQNQNNNKFCVFASDFRLFVEDRNDLLKSCGYPPFYIRNPFDWLILHCANTPYPLNEFQDAFRRYYADIVEEEF